MMNRKHLCVGGRLRAALAALLILVAAGALLQAKDKGDKDFRAADAAASKMDWDKALDLYMTALDKNPNNPAYMIGMRRARFQAGQMHVNRGQKARTDGKADEAMAEFQKAIIADPSSSIAIQELRRTQAILDEKKSAEAGESQRRRTDAGGAGTEIFGPKSGIDRGTSRIEADAGGGSYPCKMNNQPPKVMYETIGKMAGINVVFDSQYSAPQRNSNVDIATSMPIEQAFDYLAMLTHTYWKPISTNTIFVTEDNVTKRRDYEDEVVKVFYVTNATSVQEFQEIATTIRTVAEIRRVFTYNAQKALIVRGTADQVALTEKLIHDLDKPKSEVVVDVIVMQVNSQYSRSLAATLASGGTAGLQQTIAYNGPGGITTPTPVTDPTTGVTSTPAAATGVATLSQIARTSINQFSTSLPGALLNAVMSDARTKTLNKPQVRASDGMKVELIIGQRIPYATGSFSSGVGGVGVGAGAGISPLVSTQFNYADVGLKLNLTPQIHSAQELTLHIEVEVSAVDQYINIGGLSQPVIGQTKNTADIRLKEGEINILTSLSQNSDASTVGGLPGLTNIPILGQFLFGSSTKNKSTGELMIALVPHIIRTPDYSAENLKGIYAGTDQVVKLYYTPKAAEAAAAAATPSSAPAGAPPATAPQVPPGVPQAAVPIAPAPTAPPAPPAPGQARLRMAPESVTAAPGGAVQVSVQIDNATDLFSASQIRVKYDPALLKLNDATPGELFTRDGVHITSVKDIRNELGEATLTVARAPGSKGITGSGSVLMLNFTAIGKGTGTITFPDFALKNAQLQPVAVTPVELPVKVN